MAGLTDREAGQVLTRLDTIDEKIDAVLVHVQITNGRVTTLERFKDRAKGALALIVFAVPVVLTLVL